MSKTLIRKSKEAKAEGRPVEAKTLSNLDHQIWSLFPRFCILPSDLATVFNKMAQPLCMSIVQNPKLRPFVSIGIVSLITKNKVSIQTLDKVAHRSLAYLGVS